MNPDYNLERGLPANLEAEKTILGCILLDNGLYDEAAESISADEFSLDAHRRIFARMTDLRRSSKAVDQITLSEALDTTREIEKVGGVAYLSALIDGVPERASIKNYIEIVKDKALLRGVINVAQNSIGEALERQEDAAQVIARMEEAIFQLRSNLVAKSQTFHLKEFSVQVVDDIWAIKKRGAELIGYSTGINSLNAATTGIRDGELWIVGALPGRGKTALGIQIAAANAPTVPVLMFSLEMAKELVVHRILANQTDVSAGKIRNPQYLSDDNMAELTRAAEQVMGWELYIDESSELGVNELVARAKLYIRRHGVKLIIADYLRLIKAPGRELREQVGNAANCLRRIAKEENVAVVGLSQLRRPENINDRPSMISLKESGDIEAHANVCLLLYQPINTETGEPTGEDEIIIGKQRNGPLGTEKVRFSPRHLTFQERV